MSRFLTRALQPTEHSAFAAFEMNNREAYEQFNEPHPDGYYSEAGLRQVQGARIALQENGGGMAGYEALTSKFAQDYEGTWAALARENVTEGVHVTGNTVIDALLAADKTEFHEGETAGYFDGCLPIEVMAERGRETLRFGPMKPVGLTNTHKPDEKAYAVVQLRRDNKLGTLYNMVGFQTKMKYGAQTAVFKMIPGLENASFARLGGIHRNTFINSPTLLDDQMRLKSRPNIRFAGQVTGVEGYVESAAMGLLAGRMAAAQILGRELPPPPPDTAMGALITHITGGAEAKTFQPMNVNFGLFPPIDAKGGRRGRKDRYKAYTDRAKAAFTAWLS